MEKPNYDHLKTETIISFNCLQEKKGFLPLENFTIPQMRYLSLRFPYNLAKDKNPPTESVKYSPLNTIFSNLCVSELHKYQDVLTVKQLPSLTQSSRRDPESYMRAIFTMFISSASDSSNNQNVS